MSEGTADKCQRAFGHASHKAFKQNNVVLRADGCILWKCDVCAICDRLCLIESCLQTCFTTYCMSECMHWNAMFGITQSKVISVTDFIYIYIYNLTGASHRLPCLNHIPCWVEWVHLLCGTYCLQHKRLAFECNICYICLTEVCGAVGSFGPQFVQQSVWLWDSGWICWESISVWLRFHCVRSWYKGI